MRCLQSALTPLLRPTQARRRDTADSAVPAGFAPIRARACRLAAAGYVLAASPAMASHAKPPTWCPQDGWRAPEPDKAASRAASEPWLWDGKSLCGLMYGDMPGPYVIAAYCVLLRLIAACCRICWDEQSLPTASRHGPKVEGFVACFLRDARAGEHVRTRKMSRRCARIRTRTRFSARASCKHV